MEDGGNLVESMKEGRRLTCFPIALFLLCWVEVRSVITFPQDFLRGTYEEHEITGLL